MPSSRARRQALFVGRVAQGLRAGAAVTARELARERADRRASRPVMLGSRPVQLDSRAAPLSHRSWPSRFVEAFVVLGIVALALVAMGGFELFPSSVLVDVRLGSSALFFVVGGFLVLRARRVRPRLQAQRGGSARHTVRRWRERAFERLADVVGRVMLLAGLFELALALVRLV